METKKKVSKLASFFNNKPYQSIIIMFFISRIVLICLWPLFNYLAGVFNYEVSPEIWISDKPLIGNWIYYDSEHYLNIAQNGYTSRLTAFFPLYPILIRVISLTGMSLEYSGIIVSNVAFLVSLIMFYKLLKLENINSFFPIFIFLLSPITIFFMSVYTESLFVMFTISSFYYIRKKDWGKASVIIGLASLTRNSGITLFLCFSLEYLYYKGWKNNFLKDSIFIFLGLILSMLYPIYLLFTYGNPTLYIRIQTIFWNRHFRMPWEAIIQDVNKIIINPSAYLIAIFNIFSILLVCWMLLSTKKIRITYLIYSGLSTFMPLMYPLIMGYMPWTTSVSRYVFALFPLYIFFSERIKNTLLRIIFIEVNFGIMILYMTAFVGKQFIG